MPSQRRVEREGSRISAAHLPQGRCNGQQAGGGAAGAAALYEEQLGDGTPSGGVLCSQEGWGLVVLLTGFVQQLPLAAGRTWTANQRPDSPLHPLTPTRRTPRKPERLFAPVAARLWPSMQSWMGMDST